MPTSSSPVGTYNFVIVQGATLNITFTLYQDAAHTSPLVITGYTPTLMVRPSKLATTVWADLSAYCTVSGAAGRVTLAMTAVQTGLLTWGTQARWDLK